MTEKELLILEMRNKARADARNEELIKLRRWGINWEIYDGLRRLGLWPDWCSYGNDLQGLLKFGPEIMVDVTDLPRLRTVFPVVRDSGKYEVEDVSQSLVKVFLDLGFGVFKGSGWPWYVRPYYLKTLQPGDRCQIVASVETKADVLCGV